METESVLTKGTRVYLPIGGMYCAGINHPIAMTDTKLFGHIAEDCPPGEPIAKVALHDGRNIYAGRDALRPNRSRIVFFDSENQEYVTGQIATFDPDEADIETNSPGYEYVGELQDLDAILWFLYTQCPNGWRIEDGRVIRFETVRS